jgi:hypothetical protein
MGTEGDAVAPAATLEDVTASWLTEALQLRHPGVEVTSVHVGQTRVGTNATARILLNYTRAGHEAGLPATMYVKGGWDGRAVNGVVNEARFYQHLAPHLPGVNLPATYFVSVDDTSGSAVIVMEDLYARNAILCGPEESLDPDQAFDVAGQLAELHGFWFDSPELEAADWLHRGSMVADLDADSFEQETGIYGSFKEWWWEKRIVGDHAADLPAPLKDRLLVKQATANLHRLERGEAQCVVHGDPHLGNMFVDAAGRPGIYDWGANPGSWAHDLNYAIVGSLSVADRRAHERDILDHYLARLAEVGAKAPSRDDAWLSWRRQTLHGFLWVMCSPRQQPEELIALQTQRFGTAAEDHDMLEALEVVA